MIAPIDQITAISGGKQAAGIEKNGDASNSMFASVFRSAIDNVKETDADAVKAEYLMSTGQLDNPAELMIASTKKVMAVDMLVQLRNKALDAYTELTRINL